MKNFIGPILLWFLLTTTISALSARLFFQRVDLTPDVDQNFFFASDDPHIQTEERISALFKRQDSQLIISIHGHIDSPEYFGTIETLSAQLATIDGVVSLKSIASGPKNLKDARQSPLWNRILVSDDQRSTNIILFIDEAMLSSIIDPVELQLQAIIPESKFTLSGQPYIVHQIRKNLSHDVKRFSALTLTVFGAWVLILYRSVWLLTGMLICCLNVIAWTFIATDYLHVPLGILTANLSSMVFVVTFSHIIYLTYNWKRIKDAKKRMSRLIMAIRQTWPASFWSMATTVAGFSSLMFVPAKPLRDLGVAGVAGTLIALVLTYAIYPLFLLMTRQPEISPSHQPLYDMLDKQSSRLRSVAVTLVLMSIPGLFYLNTDPSMLQFFSPRSPIHRGLSYIDRNGGSSPLNLVIKADDGSTLDSQAAYERMWRLQTQLEALPSVGSVISLPVLMAEAKQEPLAIFLVWDWLLDILDKPKYERIAQSFISQDRTHGMFYLRMNEQLRQKSRLDVIGDIHRITRSNGFEPNLTGGVYYLQAQLSRLVVTSLKDGLLKLLLVFLLVGLVLNRSIRGALAMASCVLIAPLVILGVFGFYQIPLDIISSPASNIAMAIGVDALLHLTAAYRRHRRDTDSLQEAWQSARREMWPPIMASTTVVIVGFAMLLCSGFPPTQRFGLAVIIGTVIAGGAAMFVYPRLCQTSKPLVDDQSSSA